MIEKNEFVHFLEASQWFSKLSVAFENDNGSLCEIIPEVEEFFEDVSQIKNYNVKKVANTVRLRLILRDVHNTIYSLRLYDKTLKIKIMKC